MDRDDGDRDHARGGVAVKPPTFWWRHGPHETECKCGACSYTRYLRIMAEAARRTGVSLLSTKWEAPGIEGTW